MIQKSFRNWKSLEVRLPLGVELPKQTNRRKKRVIPQKPRFYRGKRNKFPQRNQPAKPEREVLDFLQSGPVTRDQLNRRYFQRRNQRHQSKGFVGFGKNRKNIIYRRQEVAEISKLFRHIKSIKLCCSRRLSMTAGRSEEQIFSRKLCEPSE